VAKESEGLAYRRRLDTIAIIGGRRCRRILPLWNRASGKPSPLTSGRQEVSPPESTRLRS